MNNEKAIIWEAKAHKNNPTIKAKLLKYEELKKKKAPVNKVLGQIRELVYNLIK